MTTEAKKVAGDLDMNKMAWRWHAHEHLHKPEEPCSKCQLFIDFVLAVAAERVAEALNKQERDPHQFSTRSCETCQAISDLVGRDFGCVRLAALAAQAGKEK